ncbi:hypothetical protein [Cognatishimia sp.]|uniref:hypothetical protein n=1 Tax=Cognatishimia sp. TaxID=2211648 RepID=UPI0035176BCC|nr:hypothetical protein [Cognatishimia sp.]
MSDDIKDVIRDINAIYNKRCGYSVDLLNPPYKKERRLLPTGIYVIDKYSCGGEADNNATMVVGDEGSGKSSYAAKQAASLQRKYPGKIIYYIDMESHYMDSLEQLEQHGVDTDPNNGFLLIGPNTTDAMGDVMLDTIEKHPDKICGIIIDSITSSISAKSENKSIEDAVMADKAAPFTKVMDKYEQIRRICFGNTALPPKMLLVNHTRANFNRRTPYSPEKVIAGGQKVRDSAISITWLSKVKGEVDSHKRSTRRNFTAKSYKDKSTRNMPEILEFSMCVSPNEQIPQGAIDDYNAVINDAKYYGFLEGWKLNCVDIKESFSTKKDLISFLIDNQDVYTKLKAACIANYRVEVGLPATNRSEPDFLLAYLGEDWINEAAKKTKKA